MSKIQDYRYLPIAGAALAAILLVISVFTYKAKLAEANPSIIRTPSTCQTASSTSSPAYLWLPLAGGGGGSVATSTITCDLTGGSNEPAVKLVTILGQLQGSSTDTELLVSLEVSQDGQDYYPYDILATTTKPVNLGINNPQWQGHFASSTITGATNTMFFTLDIPAPARYSKISFSIASSTRPGIRNGAIWAQYLIHNELR